MKVAFRAAVVVASDARLQVFQHLQPPMHDECPSGLHQGSVVAEALQISLLSAVDVQVVGICGRNHRGKRPQVVERAVKLVRFDDHIRAVLAEQVVCAVILRDAAEESVASHVAFVEQVGAHRGGGGFAVRACHAEPLHGTSERAQHLCTFLNVKSPFAEEVQFAVVGGNGRCVDHQCVRLVAADVGDEFRVVLIVDISPLGAQFFGQGARRAVISRHCESLGKKIAFQCTHADAAGTDEIYSFHVKYRLSGTGSSLHISPRGGKRRPFVAGVAKRCPVMTLALST